MRVTRADVGAALVVSGVSVLVGLLAAVVWAAVAPRVVLRSATDGVELDPFTVEALFGADAWFVVVTSAAGLILALASWVRTRDDGVGALVGLVVGGFLAALVVWKVGHWLGPDPGAPAEGATREGPIDLRTKAALFCWPVAATVGYFALTAGWSRGTVAATEVPEPARHPA